jgi:dipeptidase E
VTTPRVVAMGGGGFSMDDPLLDDEVLRLCGNELPAVCFVPTASGDAEGYADLFTGAFPAERARASVLRLFAREIADLRGHLLEQDVIYVGGGNTANMLAVWRLHGVDAILREAAEQGALLCGLSAGAICWFEDGVTDSFGGFKRLGDGLGLVANSFCPHWDGEPEREAAFHTALAEGMPPGYAVDDRCALHFEGGVLVEAFASSPTASARWIDGEGETPLTVRFLGD